MDRSNTASPNGQRGSNHNNGEPSPPWEQRHIAQVPYMTPDSPPLTQAEQHALPSLWASRENSRHERSKSYTLYHAREDSETGNPQWPSRTPSTGPINAPPHSKPHELAQIAPGPKSAPQLPTFVKGPPSPPDSARLSRSSISKSASPNHSPRIGSKPSITAMPGTMSARERSRSRHRPTLSQDQVVKEEAEHLPLGRRVKEAFKDVFKRNPVDETKFERIEDRHWADDE